MTNPLLTRLHREVSDRATSGLFRRTPAAPDGRAGIDCASNSYLSLHNDPAVLEAAADLLEGRLGGNTASRLVTTVSALYDELEREIAGWKQSEAALVFNGGYTANVGILQAFCSRDTAVFSDRLNHASIYDGIRLAGAKLVRYQHCDMNDLEARLQESSSPEKLIVTDAVFSMDGDAAPLVDICDLAEKYGAVVMVDEAHSAGVFGDRASGLCEAAGVEDRVAIRMGTLSKAVGGLGGFFAGSALLRDHLVNHARSLIYATALPHAVLAYDLAALRSIRSHPERGGRLLEAAEHVRARLGRMGYNTLSSTTQIVPLLCETPERALLLSGHLLSHGVKAPAIRPPTVPVNTSRVRISLHAGLTDCDIELLVAALAVESWSAQ